MEISTVDLRGLEPGSPGWTEARDAATAFMVEHGFIVVAHDALDPELHRALFGCAMPELFALPVETKQRHVSSLGPHRGYSSDITNKDYESMRLSDVTDAGSVREFADLMWPQGNSAFCDTIVSAAKKLLGLMQTVEKMILEGLGVRIEAHVDAHMDTLTYSFRLMRYGVPPDTQISISLPSHVDDTVLSMIIQHEEPGLEVQTKDGSWITVPPVPGTLTILAGKLFALVTNGWVPPCLHRVKSPSNRERLSVLFGCRGKDGVVLSAMDDLVDDDHPLLYKPCTHDSYTKFLISSNEGDKFSDPLKAFCGVEINGLATEG